MQVERTLPPARHDKLILKLHIALLFSNHSAHYVSAAAFYHLCECVTGLALASQDATHRHRPRLSIFTNCHFSYLYSHHHKPKSLHSIFINVTSQLPGTPLLLVAVSIVPFAETPTMWVSSIFGNQGGLAAGTGESACGCAALCCTIML